MIDTVTFENAWGERLQPHHMGVILKSHDAPPPRPKLYTFSLDGMDGALDLSEWAGEVKYENREVRLSFRDMSADFYREITQFCLGRMVKITFSDAPEWYYHGRCSEISSQTRRRVADMDMTFVCEPYKRAVAQTVLSRTISGSGSILLRARRMSVIPKFTLSADCTITYDGQTYTVAAGTRTVSGIVITDRPKTMAVSTASSATVKLTWRDGEL